MTRLRDPGRDLSSHPPADPAAAGCASAISGRVGVGPVREQPVRPRRAGESPAAESARARRSAASDRAAPSARRYAAAGAAAGVQARRRVPVGRHVRGARPAAVVLRRRRARGPRRRVPSPAAAATASVGAPGTARLPPFRSRVPGAAGAPPRPRRVSAIARPAPPGTRTRERTRARRARMGSTGVVPPRFPPTGVTASELEPRHDEPCPNSPESRSTPASTERAESTSDAASAIRPCCRYAYWSHSRLWKSSPVGDAPRRSAPSRR
jgi:hypothetical protein